MFNTCANVSAGCLVQECTSCATLLRGGIGHDPSILPETSKSTIRPDGVRRRTVPGGLLRMPILQRNVLDRLRLPDAVQ